MRVLRPRLVVGLASAFAIAAFAAPVSAQIITPAPISVTPPAVADTGPLCSVQLHLSNPSPGDQQVPRSLVMSGTAADRTAPADSADSISQVQAFLGDRNTGGLFIGQGSFSATSPESWSLTTSIPESVSGGQNLFVYATSAISGQVASVEVPVVIGMELPSGITVSDTPTVSCPSIVRAPSPPLVALSGL
ncbi:MAG: hypothetical protein JO318_07520 [Chloroflexi bacterium]|nr:hypothetical protein [Chloroflexota bacterium]MBV9132532.1 hypothetical protein [Chloroflexota bacterium]